MSNHPCAADGAHTKRGVPHGYTSLSPHLAVQPANQALDFYREVFGAQVLDVTRAGDIVIHATLELEAGRFTLSDPMEAYGLAAPRADQASVTLSLYVSDVDAVVSRALSAGATLREPISDFVSGDRYGSIVDPFSVRWTIMTRIEDLSPEESARRVAEWAKQQG